MTSAGSPKFAASVVRNSMRGLQYRLLGSSCVPTSLPSLLEQPRAINTGAHADQAAMAAPEPCGAEGLGTDLGTAVRHAESRLAAMQTALDMISRGAGFSWQPRGLVQGRGGPGARTGHARAPRSAIHAFCHCLLILVPLSQSTDQMASERSNFPSQVTVKYERLLLGPVYYTSSVAIPANHTAVQPCAREAACCHHGRCPPARG
eukprot:COSAG05_NODE_3_length_51333_cov_129.132080_22_plen_205_part_00